jgi:large subunit ribosomal protein L3
MKGIMGRKVGMTQLLTARGEVVPVTIIEAGPCFVTQIKTTEKDGYSAIQLGLGEVRQKRLTKGQIGHLRRAGKDAPLLRVLREFRLKNVEDYAVGQKLLADVFASGERVDVQGSSRAAVSGGVKRHGFAARGRTASQTGCGRRASLWHAGADLQSKRMATRWNVPVTVPICSCDG